MLVVHGHTISRFRNSHCVHSILLYTFHYHSRAYLKVLAMTGSKHGSSFEHCCTPGLCNLHLASPMFNHLFVTCVTWSRRSVSLQVSTELHLSMTHICSKKPRALTESPAPGDPAAVALSLHPTGIPHPLHVNSPTLYLIASLLLINIKSFHLHNARRDAGARHAPGNHRLMICTYQIILHERTRVLINKHPTQVGR